MAYPNLKAARPFAVEDAQTHRAVATMPREQLESALLREMELRGLWEVTAVEMGADPDATLERLHGPRA